jgi:LPS export ABC transporter protein LptC
MGISRRKSQQLAAVLLLSLFAVLVVAVLTRSPTRKGETPVEQRIDSSETASLENQIDLETNESQLADIRPIVVDQFQRSFSKDGELTWSARGTRALIYSERSEIVIEDGTVNTTDHDGTPLVIRAQRAKLELESPAAGGGLRRARGSEGVEITSESGILITEDAVLDFSVQEFSGATPVSFTSKNMVVKGTGFTFDIKDRVLSVSGRVTTEIAEASE